MYFDLNAYLGDGENLVKLQICIQLLLMWCSTDASSSNIFSRINILNGFNFVYSNIKVCRTLYISKPTSEY
jgi:hypothetical protein